MANLVQLAIIDLLAHVLDGALRVDRRDDGGRFGNGFARRQSANFAPRHLFTVNVDPLGKIVNCRVESGQLVIL